ncbi:MAG: alpha-2,8-polysialyltransferase family protein [Lachnospiraceae bacterium]|nr:alpha-2,8-polysialyltransferase family protein [Muribaculaceae bacterium]MCM1409732.1 alpha-2,8-polysialyltransferase family protein [Lachnospiraceae bacterium]
MVLYHGITAWHILECWVHRLKKYRDDDAILILPDFILAKYPNILQAYPENIFFIKIIEYKKLNFELEEELFEQALQSIVESMDIGEYINNQTEIYVAGAQYMFSHYLIQRKISFYFVEEAPGRLTTAEIVKENLWNINRAQYNIALKEGMFTGDSAYVKSIVCNIASQIENAELPYNIKDFDVVKELQKLSKEDIEIIKDFFNVPNITFPNNTALVLTQHFANLDMTSYIEQALVYQMTIDYFLDDNCIYVKPHPDDLMNYDTELQNCKVIHGIFPSELLEIISEIKPTKLLAISSASILNLKKYYKEVVVFNPEYLRTFYLNHQYYLFANIAKELDRKNIVISNINVPQLTNMMKIIEVGDFIIKQIKENDNQNIFFIGADSNELIQTINKINDEDTVFVFLDSKIWLEASGGRDACLSHGLCKPIYISAIDKDEYPETGVFYLYIYCKNKETRRRIAKMHYVKKLINSGIETTVPELDDKDMEIAVLKGILNATEKRLSTYLNNSKNKKEEGKLL